MSLISRIAGRRSLGAIPISDPALNDLIRDSILLEPTYTGNTVTVEKSLRLVPVYAAVNLLSSAVSSLPLRVYRNLEEGGKETADSHPAARILSSQPNPLMGPDEFVSAIMAGLLLWGNGFAMKEKAANGRLVNLWPIAPSRLRVSRHPQTGFPEYYVDGRGPYSNDTIIHFRGLSFDGLVGFSPIQQARETLGIHQAMEEHSGRFWASAARPAGALMHPNRLSPEGAERLRAQFDSQHAGVRNSSKTLVLEEGVTWTSLALPDSDRAVVEQLGLSARSIAQLFNVPLRLLQIESRDSFHYTNSEWESADFLRCSLRRWLVRIEGTLQRDNDLFPSPSNNDYFPRFDTSELTRGDRSGQATTDIALLQAGVLSVDEVRSNLDLNPAGQAQDLSPEPPIEPDAPVVEPEYPMPPVNPAK